MNARIIHVEKDRGSGRRPPEQTTSPVSQSVSQQFFNSGCLTHSTDLRLQPARSQISRLFILAQLELKVSWDVLGIWGGLQRSVPMLHHPPTAVVHDALAHQCRLNSPLFRIVRRVTSMYRYPITETAFFSQLVLQKSYRCYCSLDPPRNLPNKTHQLSSSLSPTHFINHVQGRNHRRHRRAQGPHRLLPSRDQGPHRGEQQGQVLGQRHLPQGPQEHGRLRRARPGQAVLQAFPRVQEVSRRESGSIGEMAEARLNYLLVEPAAGYAISMYVSHHI